MSLSQGLTRAPRPHAIPGAIPGAIPDAIPSASVGVGLKPEHVDALLADPGSVSWVEIHAENYMHPGGPQHRALETVRRDFPLSVHGVGLSLGGAHDLDGGHLSKLAAVVDRYQPALVSEHLAWCGTVGTYLNDLLAVPYTDESLDLLVRHIDQTQEALGRRILVENPSRYFAFTISDMEETAFLTEMVRRTGCGLLLDVNNIVVSAGNLGFDPLDYLKGLPLDAVGEIHLAGHAVRHVDGVEIRIDDHGSAVSETVLALYELTLRLAGPRPTLIERDSNIPPWPELAAEAARVASILTPEREPA